MAPKNSTRNKLNSALIMQQIEWAADKAKKVWPGVALGLVGQHRETKEYYFAETGNNTPFILDQNGKKVSA